jgi:hypothetical protein
MSAVYNHSPSETYTLPDEVEKGKDLTMSYGYMQFKAIQDGTIHPYQTLIGKYHNILSSYIKTRTFTEEEYNRYYQNPKRLSMDIYGTPELWSGLLYINNCVSVANFTAKTVKVFTLSIIEALEELTAIYSNDITKNRQSVYGDE